MLFLKDKTAFQRSFQVIRNKYAEGERNRPEALKETNNYGRVGSV